MNRVFFEVPSRIELLYTVLQTVASPLGQGTVRSFTGAKLKLLFLSSKFFRENLAKSTNLHSKLRTKPHPTAIFGRP